MKTREFNNQYLTDSAIQEELHTHLSKQEVQHDRKTRDKPFDPEKTALNWLKSTATKDTSLSTLASYVSLYRKMKSEQRTANRTRS